MLHVRTLWNISMKYKKLLIYCISLKAATVNIQLWNLQVLCKYTVSFSASFEVYQFDADVLTGLELNYRNVPRLPKALKNLKMVDHHLISAK